MATYRMNLAGTYEFFTLSDAHAAMDRGNVPAGAIVVVDGRTYVAMWYDEEKRMVLRRTRGDEEDMPRSTTLLPPPRSGKGRKRFL